MSQENVEAVYRVYEAISRRDVDAFVSETHPDVEGTSYIMAVDGTTFRGHAGMRQFLAELYSVFPDIRLEVADAVAGTDAAVATMRLVATSSGVPVQQTAYQAVRFKEGKAIWWAGLSSRTEALEAVGLSE